MSFGTGIAIIKTFEWIWKSFGKDITQYSSEQVKELWQKFGFKDAAENYYKNMRRIYGTMHIWRMSSSVNLENIFTNVNVLDKPSTFQRAPKDQLERIYLVEANFGKIITEGKSGLEAVHENDRLFILGKPGSGKTTFLKYITLQAIEGKLDRIPIFISLKSFSESGLSLLEYIAQQFDICKFPEAQPFIKIILENAVNFRLTERTFAKLRQNSVEEDVLDKLQELRGQEFLSKEKFIKALEQTIGIADYKTFILNSISKSYKCFQIDNQILAELKASNLTIYKITWHSINSLEKSLSEPIIQGLKSLKNHEVVSENNFLRLIGDRVGEAILAEYKDPISKYLPEPKGNAFSVTEQSVSLLKKNRLPEIIIKNLTAFIGQPFSNQSDLISIIQKQIGEAIVEENRSLILESAHVRKIEIPADILTTIEEDLSHRGYSDHNHLIDDIKKVVRNRKYQKVIIDHIKKRGNVFKVNESLFTLLKKELPLDIFEKLKTLRNKKYQTQDEFTSAVNDILTALGTVRYESIVIDSSEKRKAVVLFDGLDEVSKDNNVRNKVIQAILNFCNKYNESQFIITCRVAASEYFFPDFTYVEMADFNIMQIKSLVRKWFADAPNIANRFFYEFEHTRNSRLKELAKNPLILTLLCIAFEETLHFPNRRSEIYEEALDALLKKWDSSRRIYRGDIYQRLSLGRKRQMFERIAAETFEDGEYLWELEQLESKVVDYLQNLPSMSDTSTENEEIDGCGIIRAIEEQYGIFVERSHNIYSFSHLTFQEYYTARYIVENRRLKELINEHLADDKWREVFLLTAEMLAEADDFFVIFLLTLESFAKEDRTIYGLLVKIKTIVEQIMTEDDSSKTSVALESIESYRKRRRSHVRNSINIENRAFLVRRQLIQMILESNFQKARAIVVCANIARINEIRIPYNFNDFDFIIDLLITFAINSSYSVHGTEQLIKLSLEEERFLKIPLGSGAHIRHDLVFQELRYVIDPKSEHDESSWKLFTDILLKCCLMTDARYAAQSEYYEFTKAHFKRLNEYFRTVELLRECLAVAYVTERNSIEDSLFLHSN